MSKEYRRDKEDFDNSDWLVGKGFYNEDNRNNDVKKRKRASKDMSRERSKNPEFH